MSNSSATRKPATGRSDQAGRPAPHAAHITDEKFQKLLYDFFDTNEFSYPIEKLCDTIHVLVTNNDMDEEFKIGIIYSQLKLIRFIAELADHTRH